MPFLGSSLQLGSDALKLIDLSTLVSKVTKPAEYKLTLPLQGVCGTGTIPHDYTKHQNVSCAGSWACRRPVEKVRNDIGDTLAWILPKTQVWHAI